MNADPTYVLLAEDEPAHAEAIRRAIEYAADPIELVVVGTLAELRAAVSRRIPDVVLADLNLPDGRVDEVLAWIDDVQTCPVLVMTSFGDQQTAAAAIKAGALDYIVKSSEAFHTVPQRLAHALREWATRQAKVRAEAAIRERDAKYRAAIETSADGFWMADLAGRILEVNAAYARMSGYSREELLTLNETDLRAGDAGNAEAAEREKRLREQGSVIYETQHRKKDGTVWHVEVDAAVWDISEGRVFAFIRDITRRKRSEYLMRLRAQVAGEAGARTVDELLQFGLDQMELLTGSSIGFFHFVEPDQVTLRLQTWSTNTLRNMCKADAKGQHYSIDQAGVWVDCVRTKAPVIHNDYIALPNRKGMPEGHAPVVRELVVPVLSGESVIAICGVGNKTSDYVREDVEAVEAIASIVTHLALRKQTQEEFEHFFNLVPDLVCIASEDGFFHRLNPQWERALGWTPAELMAQPFLSFVHPDDQAETSRTFDAEKTGGTWVSGFINRYRAKDGSWHWIEWNATPMSGDTRMIFAAARDITGHRALEAQLRQTQRMEAVGQLAGGVAHDYNNILAAMMMHLGLLKDQVGLPADVQQTVTEIHKLADRSAALTRQLLMFSRRSVLTIRTIDLNRVITDLVKMLRRLIGEHVAFEFMGAPNLPSVQADSGMMEQVVTNLCVNGRDAMPKGGRLIVTTAGVDIGPDRATRTPDARVGRFVQLSVRDTGTGMTEDVMQRIFEPFFTTKEAGKGTGLGLATVFGIVKQHNGWLEVESAVGTGSTFHVYLPADATHCEEEVAAAKPRAQGGTETILVVEDEESVRRTITLVLRRYGYRVLQASNGPDAQDVWADHRDSIALLYTDMVMPGGLTGLDLARQFRGEKPSLRVIVSSGYSGDLVGSAATAEGELVFVPKPVASDDLVRTVRDTIDGKRPD